MTALPSTERFVCAGWYDADGGHHGCQTPDPKPQAKGRCGRCYTREYSANGGKVRPAIAVVPAAAPACLGWDDAIGERHACLRNHGPALADGRCARCARMQRGADHARAVLAREDRPSPGLTLTVEEVLPPETAERLRAAAVVTVEREQPSFTGAQGAVPAGDRRSSSDPRHTVAATPDDGYAWALFDQSPHIVRPNQPAVSIGKDGDCRLNGPAVALWGVRQVEAVEVLYDLERRAIALRPCEPAVQHARKLRPDKRARCLSLRGFRSATGLPGVGQAARATPRLVGELLVIDLP